jgi:cell wall integrity and stress response component
MVWLLTLMIVSDKATVASATATPTESSTKSGGKSNTVGIAVGVVVGVLAVAAIAGGLFFYMRRKRAQELDEKTRHDAVISNFFGGASPSSISDSRVDPAMSQRRYSNGSIADNQDYSRKILRVSFTLARGQSRRSRPE